MQKQQAINIVHETFESAFDKVRFTNFIKNLLNEPDLTDGFGVRSGQYIPDAYKGYVEKYERLGKFEDEDEKRIDILIVHLKRDTSIERARSMQRNFVAGYLQGKFGSDVPKDAALVAFVSPNGEDWRFSLVKLEVRLEANDDGKLKVSDEFTPAKRWSFLVGSQEKSHTAQRQFVPIMQDTDNNPTLAQLEEAFNIETVTKEFFNAYRELFIRTKGELDKLERKDAKVKAEFERKGIDTVNLAKKLLGQIVFLYYLQKKGWFGVPRDAAWGEGSRAFLRELFEKKHGEYKNFFNDVLEPLFYEALRIDRSHDDHYYSRFDCKIPFLNGGLFDPMNNYDWVKTDLLLPNTLFSNRTKDDPEGDGILDVFDLYNFTVKEDEPFEKEVAIDPELLGKAYEKFNAIRPDNYAEFLKALESGKKGEESKFNKQYGVYYTPREIVHYMCQQSLINYLYTELNPHRAHQGMGQGNLDMFGNAGKQGQLEITTEHAIEEISKEDIALLIQHGENWRENEERVNAAGKETETYSYKIPESIRVNASLLDEKLAGIKVCDPAVGSGAFPVGMMSEIVRAREVLKTWTKTKKTAYDFKRECIENSLYGVDIDSGAVEIAKLRLWLSLVVDEDDPQNIKPLPNLDYKIVCGNSLLGFPDGILLNSSIQTKIEEKKQEYFSITNPIKKLSKREEISSLFSQLVESAKQYDSSLSEINFDFQIHFSEVFHEKRGFDVVIANPPYDVYQGDKETEIKVLRKMPVYVIAEGGKLNAYKLFLAKSVKLQKPNGILCEIFQNSFLADTSATKLRKYFLENQKLMQLDSFPERDNEKLRVFEDVKMSICIMLCSSNKQANYEFNLNIWKDKFMSSSKSIKLSNTEILKFDPENATIPSISQSELEVLKKVSLNKRLKTFAKCYEGEINLTFHKHLLRSPAKSFAKMIKGAAVQKWFLTEKMSQGEVEYLDKTSYLKENSGKKSTHFKLKRIVMQGITGVDEKIRLKMTVMMPESFCGNSVNYILIEDKRINDEFLLGLLNSKLLNWFFKVFSTNSNVNGYEVDNLPIPPIAGINQEPIVKLVERILAAKGKNPQADTSKEESAIDEMVYQLYGLTEEEIRIVEGKE
jgi:Alw26I/Eco31I/Esp3I family type II restriction m6 adenine DNA methyltransferase